MNAMSTRRAHVIPQFGSRNVNGVDGTTVFVVLFLLMTVGAAVGATTLVSVVLPVFLGAVCHQVVSTLGGMSAKNVPAQTRAMIDAALLD